MKDKLTEAIKDSHLHQALSSQDKAVYKSLEEYIKVFKSLEFVREINSRLRQLQQSMAAYAERYCELLEAHREIDSGFTRAIKFWEEREPEVAVVYRELRDALRDATVFDIPEAFIKGTATTRSRVGARSRWAGRDKDKLVEKVRAKAMELQGERSKNSIARFLAHKSKEFFGVKISAYTIRDWLKDSK